MKFKSMQNKTICYLNIFTCSKMREQAKFRRVIISGDSRGSDEMGEVHIGGFKLLRTI